MIIQQAFQQRPIFNSDQLSQTMFRAILACLIVSLAALGAAAQSKMSAGGQLYVVSPPDSIPLNQEKLVEIRFLDARDNHVPATGNLTVTVTASITGNLIAARGSVKPQSVQSLDKAAVTLSKSADHSIVEGIFPVGWSSIWVRFRSERGGTIKIFATSSGILPGSGTVNVQGPSQISVKMNVPTISLRKNATVTISLLDYQGKETTAPADYPLTVTATSLGSLGETRNIYSGVGLSTKSLQGKSLIMSRSGTSKLSGIIPAKSSRVALHFRSDLPGTIRIFVEGVGLSNGFTPVSVAQQSLDLWQQTPPKLEMVPAFFTNRFAPQARMLPAFWQPCAPAGARLEIKLKDESARGDFQLLWVELFVDDKSVAATCDIPVSLRSEELPKPVKLGENQVTIRAGSAKSQEVEIESKCSKEVRLSARAQTDGVNPANRIIPFKPQRRAAKLKLDPSPRRAVANGLSPIYLTVTAFDGCGARISMKDEELSDPRRVIFDYPHSLRFETGAPSALIPAEKTSETIRVFSSKPVSEMLIGGKSANALGEEIYSNDDESKVSFNLPILEFLFALIGGCLLPLISFLRKRNWGEFGEVIKGSAAGAVAFFASFFGALITDTASWGALAMKITSFPTDNVFGALILGLIGYLLVVMAEKTTAKVKQLVSA